MCRIIVSLIILSFISYIFAQHHHIKRRGVQIRGSFGQGLKNRTGSHFLYNRFGEDASKIQHKHIQILGYYGHKHNVTLGNRFGESNTTENKPVGSGCAEAAGSEPGIGCKSTPLNEILANAGLGGSTQQGGSDEIQIGLRGGFGDESGSQIIGSNNGAPIQQISTTYLPVPGSGSVSPNNAAQAQVSGGGGFLSAPYPYN